MSFSLLDVRVLVKINNRKVLTGFAEICGFPDKVVDITVAIDKLDKIGLEAVENEMREKGLTDSAIAVIEQILKLSGTTAEKIASMRSLMNGGSASGIVSEAGLKGLDELEELFGLIDRDRPFPRPWPELLHGCHLRGKGARFRHRKHLWRRSLRQSYRNIRPAGHVGSRNQFRS